MGESAALSEQVEAAAVTFVPRISPLPPPLRQRHLPECRENEWFEFLDSVRSLTDPFTLRKTEYQ